MDKFSSKIPVRVKSVNYNKKASSTDGKVILCKANIPGKATNSAALPPKKVNHQKPLRDKNKIEKISFKSTIKSEMHGNLEAPKSEINQIKVPSTFILKHSNGAKNDKSVDVVKPDKKRQVNSVLDTKKCVESCEKENEEKIEMGHILQKDFEFVPCELSRQLLLSGREISPSVFKMQQSQKLSFSAQRSSFYHKLCQSSNPLKDALKAVEKNLCLTNPRPSEVNNLKYLSPIKVKHSPHDYKQALKSLEAMRTKKLNKSSKKVTFNLNLNEEYKDMKNENIQPESNTKLTVISEKGESSQNTSNEEEKNLSVLTEELKTLNLISCSSESSDSNNENTASTFISKEEHNMLHSPLKAVCSHMAENCNRDLLKRKEPNSMFISDCLNAEESTNKSKAKYSDPTAETVESFSSANNSKDQQLKKSSNHCLVSNVVCSVSNCSNFTHSIKNDYNLLPKCQDHCNTEGQIVTPCVYRYKSAISNSGSPEFLDFMRPKKIVINQTPIYTPFVLKSLATDSEIKENVTPICVKLNFDDIDFKIGKESDFNQTPLKSCNLSAVSLQDIPTTRKVLDKLADQECSIILCDSCEPILCGRYIRNPIAHTLDEGDEMHFLPVSSPQHINFM